MSHTILVVEDNDLNRKLFTELLKMMGYEVLYSIDGSDVIDIAREHKPDLILMDIQLPERSGIEITQDLKSDDALKNIPVIAITAFAMKGDKDKIMAAGFCDYIAKPISIPPFCATIKSHLPD